MVVVAHPMDPMEGMVEEDLVFPTVDLVAVEDHPLVVYHTVDTSHREDHHSLEALWEA